MAGSAPRRSFLVVTALVLAASNGCATRYSPTPLYLVPATSAGPATAAPPCPPPTPTTPPTMVLEEREPHVPASGEVCYGVAVEYARALARAYRQALANEAAYADRAALLLLPLAAAGIGLGLAGVTGDPFVALGMATATGFGLTTWFRNPQLRDAFAVGYQALQCLLEKAPPAWLQDPTRGPTPALETRLDELRASLESLATRLERLRLRAERSKDSDFKAGAGVVLAAGERALGRGRTAHAEAAQILSILRSSGTVLYQNTEKIRGFVTAAAVRGQTDVAALPEILKATIQASYQDVFGALAAAQAEKAKAEAEAAKAQTTEEKAEQVKRTAPKTLALRTEGEADAQALRDVEEALESVAATLEGVEGLVRTLNYGGVAGEFARCLTPVSTLAARRDNPIVVRPSSVVQVTLDPKKDATSATIVVTGGVVATPEDYRLQPTWKDDTDISVDDGTTVGHGRQYVIAVGKDVTPGAYYLVVRDVVGAERTVRIEVKVPPAKKPVP